jgi:hypothetical protein
MEGQIAASLLTMEIGIDELVDGKVRVLGDGGLEPFIQRRKLGIDQDGGVVTDHGQNAAAAIKAFEHVGPAAKSEALMRASEESVRCAFAAPDASIVAAVRCSRAVRRLIHSSIRIIAILHDN